MSRKGHRACQSRNRLLAHTAAKMAAPPGWSVRTRWASASRMPFPEAIATMVPDPATRTATIILRHPLPPGMSMIEALSREMIQLHAAVAALALAPATFP